MAVHASAEASAIGSVNYPKQKGRKGQGPLQQSGPGHQASQAEKLLQYANAAVILFYLTRYLWGRLRPSNSNPPGPDRGEPTENGRE
eukprot:jgi/Chlat1/4622/Chrsp3S05587